MAEVAEAGEGDAGMRLALSPCSRRERAALWIQTLVGLPMAVSYSTRVHGAGFGRRRGPLGRRDAVKRTSCAPHPLRHERQGSPMTPCH